MNQFWLAIGLILIIIGILIIRYLEVCDMYNKLPKFQLNDQVRMADNTVGIVVGFSKKKDYYLVENPIHGGRFVEFAGNLEKVKGVR